MPNKPFHEATDEEIMSDFDSYLAETYETSDEEEAETETSETVEPDEDEAETEVDTETEETPPDATETGTKEEASEEEAATEDAEKDAKAEVTSKGELEAPDGKEEVISPEDAQAQLQQIFKPFRANGSEMQVRSVDEAIRLMQQGANYAKKMTAIKPHLRRVKTLEANDLTDDDINLLVDLKKGDKGAIKKLLQDSKVDALDLDLDETEDYTPKDYGVSQSQFDLSSVLEEIQDSEAYPDTIRIVGKEWDEASRVEVGKNPALVRGIHDQVANGDYAIVKAEVDRERALGRLTDVNDLEAYVQTFQRLHTAQQAATAAPVTPKSTGDKVDHKEEARKKAKAAASTTQPKAKTVTKPVIPDLSKTSDDDFLKVYEKTFDFN